MTTPIMAVRIVCQYVCYLGVILFSFLMGIGLVGMGQAAFAEENPFSLSSSSELLYPAYDGPAYDGMGASKNPKSVDWLKIIREQIPPLTHERGHRWPLVLISGVGGKVLSDEDIRMLLARGMTQHLKPDSASIPAAHALQKAGSPVILMMATHPRSAWPYTLEQDKTQWAHQYPDDLKVFPHWRDLPSPTRFRGWAVAGDDLRKTLSHFRSEKIIVDALWMDHEGEPSQANYYAAILSPTTRALLPPEAVVTEKAFRLYCRQLWVQLLSSYMAGPAREIFPKVSITNWIVTLSSPERPVLGWENQPHPPLGPTLFTATTPVAYGIDTAFLALWQKTYRLDKEHVDQFYMHILLRQVSADSENRQRQAPYMNALPWVGRWVMDYPDKKVPIMGRERYREALRHLWLRGIDGMQVFNPVYAPNMVGMAIAEVQDAVAIYDEMLAYRDFLEKGVVMHVQYPKIQARGPLWSGLRLEDEAIVRVFWQGSTIGRLTIKPWVGSRVTLNNPTRGATFHLRRHKKTNKVDILSVRR